MPLLSTRSGSAGTSSERHDRAQALFSAVGVALRTQYALLVLVVVYTVGGLWLLSRG